MLLFVIILILGSLTLYICFRFHRNIQKILLIIKNIIKKVKEKNNSMQN